MAGGVGFRTPTSNTAAAATSLVLTVPTGTQAGDLMLAYFSVDGTHPVTSFTGWTSVDSQVWGGSPAFTGIVFKRTATSSEPSSYTANNSGASNWLGIMLTLTGVDTNRGVSGQDALAAAGVGFGAVASCNTGSMTTVQDGDAVINFVGTEKAGTQIATFTPPSGYVDIKTLVGSTMAIEISAGVKLSAGATGAQTTGFSATSVTGAVTGLAVFARHIPIGARPSIAHIVRTWEPPFILRPRYAVATDSVPANIFPAPTLSATAVLGTVALRVDGGASPTGLAGTAALGTPQVFSMLHVIAQAQLGTVTITNDMIFALPRGLFQLRPVSAFVNTPSLSIGSSPTAASLLATAQLGSVVYQSSVNSTGLAAASALGVFTTRVNVSLSPAGQQALAQLGVSTYQSAYAVTGQTGTAQLGSAIVRNNNLFPELGVSSGASVGSVGFSVTGSVSPLNVSCSGVVGTVGFRFDNTVAVLGVSAASNVGGSAGYGAIVGVQGVGQVGVALAQTSLNASPTGLQGIAGLGNVVVQFDNRATVTGVAATGRVGAVDFTARFVQSPGLSLYARTVLETLWSTD
jgi:hypothetical protein